MLKKMSVVLGLAVTVVAVACGGGGQPQECKDYVACAEKIGSAAGPESIKTVYGPSGTCFTGGASTVCTDNCKTGLSGLKTAYPDAGCT